MGGWWAPPVLSQEWICGRYEHTRLGFSPWQGVGTVVSGTTLRGLIKLNDTLLLGPDPLGNFLSIAVKSIHRKRMPVKEVRGGQTASFALKKVSEGHSLPELY